MRLTTTTILTLLTLTHKLPTVKASNDFMYTYTPCASSDYNSCPFNHRDINSFQNATATLHVPSDYPQYENASLTHVTGCNTWPDVFPELEVLCVDWDPKLMRAHYRFWGGVTRCLKWHLDEQLIDGNPEQLGDDGGWYMVEIWTSHGCDWETHEP